MKKKKFNVKDFLIGNNTYVIFLVLFIVCALLSSTFLEPVNLVNICLQQSGPILVALGMLFVVLTGGIDLSVGAVTALSSCCAYVLMRDYGQGLGAAFVVAVLIGLAMGLLNGILVAYGKMQGFVTTLATLSIGNGAALIVSQGAPVRCSNIPSVGAMASKDYGYPIVIGCVIIIVIMALIQQYTSYGRIVIACGSNSTAVQLAGINVKRYVCSCYMVSGLLASIAGMFIASRTQTAASTLGKGGELDAIAACVIGGASLAGGKGSVIKTVIGALTIALISNIMNLKGVPAYPQEIVKGCIIIAAVLLQIATDRTESAV
ncbi:ABC transporter permease [Muricomes intestini]|jgi:ribose transport system permease protein|uniref:Monosaccharide ABC transporter membrane protein (CUT2 family) n=1 Tax=Muricomes intestini TaxID=1796634 RepID=A0A4R3KD88_9FIRM|nr:ABC transporter permease [Muricomes intestini]TCS81137.1 monosaccharide ABC transporter membrane protein (CUT2 family) [Muricomes intestini]HAX52055.1 ABC transporter permease [Lachnospiraceae bacterium]